MLPSRIARSGCADSALVHFARLFAESRRQEDIVARVGGEEFALLLPGTDLRDAMAIADQLCAKIGATPLDITIVGLPITASFGVAAISEKDKSLDDIVLRADRRYIDRSGPAATRWTWSHHSSYAQSTVRSYRFRPSQNQGVWHLPCCGRIGVRSAK